MRQVQHMPLLAMLGLFGTRGRAAGARGCSFGVVAQQTHAVCLRGICAFDAAVGAAAVVTLHGINSQLNY